MVHAEASESAEISVGVTAETSAVDAALAPRRITPENSHAAVDVVDSDPFRWATHCPLKDMDWLFDKTS